MNKSVILNVLKEIAVEHVPKNSGDAFESGFEIGKKEKSQIGYSQDDIVNKFSPETAMGIGYDAGRLGLDNHSYDDSEDLYIENPDILADWVGIRKHSMAPDERSYRRVGDILAIDPGLAYEIIQPLMEKTGAACPVSAAKAVSDIIELIASHQHEDSI